MEAHHPLLDEVADLMAAAQSLLFITGAGLSADSGLPTYRGSQGLYQDTPVEEGMPIEQVLSGAMFLKQPDLTWKYLQRIREANRQAGANLGHRVIAALEQTRPRKRVWVLTQNIDGLHQAAGSHQVIDIHGDVNRLRCTWCSQGVQVRREDPLVALPRCTQCGGRTRPDVVLFGEPLPEPQRTLLDRELNKGFDLVLSVGTSSLLPYIRAPLALAHSRGLPTVEINPEPTAASPFVRHRIPLGAAAALHGLWQRLPGGSVKRPYQVPPPAPWRTRLYGRQGA